MTGPFIRTLAMEILFSEYLMVTQVKFYLFRSISQSDYSKKYYNDFDIPRGLQEKKLH